MVKDLEELIAHFEKSVAAADKQRKEDGAVYLGFCEIKLLGQFSLLAFEDKNLAQINIRRTDDIDAQITGDANVGWLFRQSVKEYGLEFDDLSNEIWLPDDATFIPLKESPLFRISAVDPISAFISKAVKAPEKNKILIREALAVYGVILEKRLIEHGVDLNFFRKATS
jgi:hypothetical protein